MKKAAENTGILASAMHTSIYETGKEHSHKDLVLLRENPPGIAVFSEASVVFEISF